MRFHDSFTVIDRRHYLAANILVLWLLQPFHPLCLDVPRVLQQGLYRRCIIRAGHPAVSGSLHCEFGHHYRKPPSLPLPTHCSERFALTLLTLVILGLFAKRSREVAVGSENTTTETNCFISQVQVVTKGMEEAVLKRLFFFFPKCESLFPVI